LIQEADGVEAWVLALCRPSCAEPFAGAHPRCIRTGFAWLYEEHVQFHSAIEKSGSEPSSVLENAAAVE